MDPTGPQPTAQTINPVTRDVQTLQLQSHAIDVATSQAELDHLQARLAAFLSAQRWAKVGMLASTVITLCGLVGQYLVPGSTLAVKVGLVGLIASKVYGVASQHAAAKS